MENIKLRKKLIKQFDHILQDENKLIAVEGFFDALSAEENNSKVPNSHYDLINESREKYLTGDVQGVSWEELKLQLKSRYGL